MMDTPVEPILFVQTAFLGDLALSVPTLKALRKIEPKRPLWLVCRQGFGDFLLDFGLVDRIFPIQKKNSVSYAAAFQELAKSSFHWIVSPHESLTTARWVYTLNAKRKLSFRRFWNGWIYTDRIQKNKDLPEALRQLSLLGLVNAEVKNKLQTIEPAHLVSENLPLPDPPAWTQMTLNSATPENFVAIFPGSVWLTKKWTETGFDELIGLLLERGYRVQLHGSSAEFAECERLKRSNQNVENHAGLQGLTETIRQIAHARLVISNDSGGSHLGALAGVPVLTLYGPTVIEQGFRPWSNKSGAVWVSDLTCRPCGAHGHQKCPLGHHHCMRKLESRKVFEAALKLVR